MTGIERTAEAGPEGPTGAPPAGPGAGEGVDSELLELPAPPRGKRIATMTLMALVAAASLGLLADLQGEIRYFFSSSQAVNLGEATELEPAGLTPNTYVRVQGTPMASRAVRYARMWQDREYVVFPLAGQRHVLVRAALEDPERFRTSSRRQFAGRLVTLGQLGSALGAVRAYLADEMHVPVSSETFVVLADEPPSGYAGSLVLAALCVLFVLVDVVLLVRWFRPLKDRGAADRLR